MNFDLSAEQQMLQDSVARFVKDHYSLENRQRNAQSKDGFDPGHWQTMAELGWLGLTLDDRHGGFGGNQIDQMLLMQEFGKGLVTEPYFATCVLGARLLALTADKQQQADLLPRVIDGSCHLAFGYAEVDSGAELNYVTTRATAAQRDGQDGYLINGSKSMVCNGGTADYIIITARTSGDVADTDGISLFLLAHETPGLTVKTYPTVDGLRAAEVICDDLWVPGTALLGEPGQGLQPAQSTAIDGILAISAEAIGAMGVLINDTATYITEREQFDHPLADFQVLQHRLVDMFVDYEQAKSMLYRATLETVQQGPLALRTVHGLKYLIGKAGVEIGEQAVQTHGGMGVTEELRVGHYFKRLLVIDEMFGNTDYHLQKFAEDSAAQEQE